MKTRDLDFVFDGIGLKAFTKMVDGKELKYIGGVASSTAKDLYGDVISPKGQIAMLDKLRGVPVKDQSNRGLTAWLNHSYKIPEDTLGVIESAGLEQRADDVMELSIEVRVTEENPRAIAAWKQVQDGIRHGWSIGAYFLDVEWANPDDPNDWGFLVNDVDLLEISLVGIPANQESWSKNIDAAKAAVVRSAERIVKSAKAAAPAEQRELVRKSLMHQRDDDDSNMSMDEAAVRAQMAMDCVDAVTSHGVCEHNAGQITNARAHMAAIVNWDGSHPTMDAPQVATSDTCSAITAQRATEIAESTAALETLQAQLAEAKTALNAKNAEIVTAATKLAEIKTATDAAQKAYDEAQARSLGRRTVTSPATVRSGAESSVPAEAYGKPTTEYHRALGQQMSGVVSDARSSAP